jgi:putative glutamine amidotransferase
LSRVVQRYPVVKGRPELPTTPEGWLERFRERGRTEQIFDPILKRMAAREMVFNSERELIHFARIVLEKHQDVVRESKRGQPIGTRKISIGVPFRGDGRGKSILKDMELVSQGSGYRAFILMTPNQYNSLGELVTDNGTAAAIKSNAIVVNPGYSLTRLGIDGLYISGGPHDHPATVGSGRPRAVGTRGAEAAERHKFETDMLLEAHANDIPVLGVCGGSWRLAHTKGAKIVRLDKEKEKLHAGPMTETHKHRHDVLVEEGTMLHGIVGRDNYRRWERPEADFRGPLKVAVNSVHWATSVFGGGGMRVSARDANEVEAFEDPSQHFSVGIQWHPEYAQLGLEGDGGQASQGGEHRNIMAAFGDASRDGRAARTLQRGIREMLRRKRASRSVGSSPANSASSSSSGGDGGSSLI